MWCKPDQTNRIENGKMRKKIKPKEIEGQI